MHIATVSEKVDKPVGDRFARC